MKDINLKYIEDNYLELEELSSAMNLSSDKLNQLIEDKLIPEPSYIVNSEKKIHSSLNDSYTIITSQKYFPKSILKLIENNISADPQIFKMKFKENLRSILINHRYKVFAYGNVFDENEKVDEERIELALEEEWNYFLKGIYGICTLESNEEAIIEKEIAIKRILDFIENKAVSINKDEEKLLKELNNEFNKVTSLFAPYQRDLSSRGKYLDKLLKEFSLNDLVKKY